MTSTPVIEVRELEHTYMRGTPQETEALRGVTMQVDSGQVVGIIGATGSGKSTLLQHLNGLLRPQRGQVRLCGQDLSDPHTDLRALRLRVALLFQNSEDQVFERYAADDVAFGPLQMGLPRQEVQERVRRAMAFAGLPVDQYADRFTFSLSGGERRRVALAGVLALEPEVLVLDEPMVGLDPSGRREMLALLRDWHEHAGRTIVWASHAMDEVAELAEWVYVLGEGRVALAGTPRQVFAQANLLASLGLDVPPVQRLLLELAHSGVPVESGVLTLEEAAATLAGVLI